MALSFRLEFIVFWDPVWRPVFNTSQHNTILEGGLGGHPRHEAHGDVSSDASGMDSDTFQDSFDFN